MAKADSVAETRVFRADEDAVRAVRRFVTAVADRAGVSLPQRRDVALAVSEAATNAVLHAFRDGAIGTLTVTAAYDAGHLSVSVADDGAGIAPRADSPGAGLGLGLMSRLSDGVRVRRRPAGGTEVRLLFRLRAGS